MAPLSLPPVPSSRQRGSRVPLTSTRNTESMPDHHYRPSLAAQIMAAVRRMCGEGDPYFLSRHQVASSLRLQMLLYFNVYVAVAYAILHPMLFQWKAVTWPPRIIVAVCSPMFFYVWLVMEPIRLIVGYVGNLGERVAWLAPFWILTLFPQLLTQVYFISSQYVTGWVTLPIEYVLHVLLLLLYCAELYEGYATGKRLVKKAAADYHLQPVVPEDVADL